MAHTGGWSWKARVARASDCTIAKVWTVMRSLRLSVVRHPRRTQPELIPPAIGDSPPV